MTSKLLIVLSFTIVAALSCTNATTNKDSTHNISAVDTLAPVNTKTDTAIHKTVAIVSPKISLVPYEILRKPTGGTGVFDFMYIVYVPKKIDKEKANWIFNDVIQKYGGGKIAIDVWDSKVAFSEELKIYQKEDKVYDAGGDLKRFAKERDKVTSKYDKHNIAQYSNNGQEISTKYPEDN